MIRDEKAPRPDPAAQVAPVAILPARGGSKRIPGKNIRGISGRPLISWAIESALNSQVFSDVVVSTDDPAVAAVAREAGATTPFVRPASLSDDFTSTVDVITHAVEELVGLGLIFDLACCIYPAAIFVEPSDYVASAKIASETPDGMYVSTVVRYAHPIQRALVLDDESRISFVDPAAADTRTQDLPERWHDAGQFYWGSREAWRSGIPILENSVGYPLDSWRVQDIDTEEDWLRAEALHALKTGYRTT